MGLSSASDQERPTGDSRPSGLDVIIRVHDANRLFELDRAIFSLINQAFTPVQPIIVMQRFGADEAEAVRRVVEKYDWARHQTPVILAVDGEGDLRSKLLNVGLAVNRSRYVAILDSDDYVYENAYSRLIDQLESSGAAVAFGNIKVKHVVVYDGEWIYNASSKSDVYQGENFDDLVRENFCPIHSFVIDRSIVIASDLYVDEALTRLEDYDLLLRLGRKYIFDFSLRDQYVGVYNWHIDGRNSIQVFDQPEDVALHNQGQWASARQIVWNRKLLLRTKPNANDRTG